MLPGFASIWYFPSKSVEVPVVVPLITTLTPGKGDPVILSVTTPFIIFCALIPRDIQSIRKSDN